jgi:hypothetical protein
VFVADELIIIEFIIVEFISEFISFNRALDGRQAPKDGQWQTHDTEEDLRSLQPYGLYSGGMPLCPSV